MATFDRRKTLPDRFVCAMILVIALPFIAAGANHCKIVKQGDGWQLLRNGKPFYIRGAVGWSHYDVLEDYGGNSVRLRAQKRNLDRASEHGLTAMASLPVRGERNGMNWDDERAVAEQKQRILEIVNELKDHPAVLFWAVGNELDWIPPGRPHSPKLWQLLNDIAIAIHDADPYHPVMTVVGTGRFEWKIRQIAEDCKDMDFLGINSYGDIDKVAKLARKHWPKPFVVTEWGPTGHWQVPKTERRAPIEQTSTEKARAIFDRYRQTILPNGDHCLGSYVFLWGQKQETTHTWYGMFRDGLKTESVGVMKYLWTGSWPKNRAPAVLDLRIEGSAEIGRIYLEAGEEYRANLTCYDCDYDVLSFTWDIRPEVEIPQNSYAGNMEKPAKPIAGLIRENQRTRIRFKAPEREGPYRLFVQISDGHDNAGYGNVPFYVKP
jgi:hypothetical protein